MRAVLDAVGSKESPDPSGIKRPVTDELKVPPCSFAPVEVETKVLSDDMVTFSISDGVAAPSQKKILAAYCTPRESASASGLTRMKIFCEARPPPLPEV